MWDDFFNDDGSDNYRDKLASVDNLPDDQQARYGSSQPAQGNDGVGVSEPRGYIAPAASSADVDWWNNYGTQAQPKKKKGKKSKPKPATAATRTKAEDESSSSSSKKKWEVPLVNLESPSPLYWVMGMATIMTVTFICETFQVGGYASIKENPMWGPDESTLLQMGAKYGPLILDGDWWRLFSATFLQNGLIFYVVSMILLFLARNVEREAGWWRAMFVFMISGTFGYVASSLFVPELISCGTTGAICGYLGLMMSDLIAKWRALKHPVLRLVGLIVLIAILIILGLTPFVDNFLHIGGLIMGFLLALMLLPNLNFGKCEGIVHSVFAFLAFPIMSTLFMMCLVIFFRKVDGGSWCTWCMKATCVNISGWCKNYGQ